MSLGRFSSLSHILQIFAFLLNVRVDPTFACEGPSQTEGKKVTPMQLAVECDSQNERGEMLSLLAEFTEMPNDIKLFRLSKLMNKAEKSKERREEFKKILSSLPVELVRLLASIGISYFSPGEQHRCLRERKSSPRCC